MEDSLATRVSFTTWGRDDEVVEKALSFIDQNKIVAIGRLKIFGMPAEAKSI